MNTGRLRPPGSSAQSRSCTIPSDAHDWPIVSRFEILARHVIEINQILYNEIEKPEDVHVTDHRDLIWIVYNMIVHGGFEKLHTASALSRVCHVPRATILRRLERLATIGYVVRDGKGYRIAVAFFNERLTEETLERVARVMADSARQIDRISRDRG